MDKSFCVESNTYKIFVGENIFNELNPFINTIQITDNKLFILVDENTKKKCLPKLLSNCDRLKNAEIIEIVSGEENKNIITCFSIWQTLSDSFADRNSVIINLGGGVITDIGGFTASTFKRGIKFINIPTTLLAQVDAAIGGKTGIDFENLKNQIGTFSNPEAVFIYPDFLKTLPENHLCSGFAEIIKHSLIADEKYWKKIKKLQLENISDWTEIILQSLKIKNERIIKDPFDKDLRKDLNFGHTIGHALEAFSLESVSKSLLHGEAVAIGIICESYLSFLKTSLTKIDLSNISNYISSIFSFTLINKNHYKLIFEIMLQDKKNKTRNINFTLLKSIGKALINQECSKEMIFESLDYFNNIVKSKAD